MSSCADGLLRVKKLEMRLLDVSVKLVFEGWLSTVKYDEAGIPQLNILGWKELKRAPIQKDEPMQHVRFGDETNNDREDDSMDPRIRVNPEEWAK